MTWGLVQMRMEQVIWPEMTRSRRRLVKTMDFRLQDYFFPRVNPMPPVMVDIRGENV
jgi:hypothetical protein